MSKVYRVIVIPDAQIPYHDALSMRAVERYMADETFDEWISIGDWMDFNQLGRWVKDSPEELSKSLAKDYEVANEILDRHQALIRANNRKAKFTVIAGNHDIRPEKFAEAHPQVKGLIEMEHGLHFKDRGIKYVKAWPDGELHKIGKAYFHHGLYTGQNHAKKMVLNYGVSIFYGHTHDVQSHSMVQWGKNKTLVGQSLGCICKYTLSYVGKNPTAWQQAVTTFFFAEDGTFSYYISRIFDHKFIAPNGKEYGP